MALSNLYVVRACSCDLKSDVPEGRRCMRIFVCRPDLNLTKKIDASSKPHRVESAPVDVPVRLVLAARLAFLGMGLLVAAAEFVIKVRLLTLRRFQRLVRL